MFLPKLLAAAAIAAAVPATAQAAAPWTDPVTVPVSAGQAAGDPQVLFTRTRGGVIAFNGAGSFPGAPTLRSVLGDGGPLPATPWDGARNFDTTFSARTAAAAVPHGRAAAVFSTFGPGDVGAVYLVRQTGVATLGPTQRVSEKGHIRAVSVAINTAGDVLVAWDRHGTIESRMWIGRSQRFTSVQALGTVTAAAHLSVALGADRRAVVAWIDQRVSEGNTGQKATVMATARSGSRGFLLPAKQLEAYPDTTIPGGTGIQAAYTSAGRGVIAWSGRTAVRATLLDGRLIRAPQDLAPVAPDETGDTRGLGNLAVSPTGAAVVTMVAPVDATRNVVVAAPLADGAQAFGPTGRAFVAWQIPPQPNQPNRIEFATRP